MLTIGPVCLNCMAPQGGFLNIGESDRLSCYMVKLGHNDKMFGLSVFIIGSAAYPYDFLFGVRIRLLALITIRIMVGF